MTCNTYGERSERGMGMRIIAGNGVDGRARVDEAAVGGQPMDTIIRNIANNAIFSTHWP